MIRADEKLFSLDGSPSDCVAIGLDKVLTDRRPDLILSGINSGCNVGEDVTYSGTIPNLFSEEKGVVAEGTLKDKNYFIANKILAKHDENYMPPKINNSLDSK